MPSSQVIVWMIICCIIFLVLLLFARPLRFVARTATGALIGAVCMAIMNTALTPFGVSVGINLITALIVGFLGAPGFLTLYVAAFIL